MDENKDMDKNKDIDKKERLKQKKWTNTNQDNIKGKIYKKNFFFRLETPVLLPQRAVNSQRQRHGRKERQDKNKDIDKKQ